MPQQTDHIGETNKMVNMKLYTEEQLVDAISKAFRYKSNVEILKSLTPIELPSDEEIIGRFMNWFLKHYSTATIDGFFGYVNSLEEEVSIREILDDYFTKNK